MKTVITINRNRSRLDPLQDLQGKTIVWRGFCELSSDLGFPIAPVCVYVWVMGPMLWTTAMLESCVVLRIDLRCGPPTCVMHHGAEGRPNFWGK